MKNREKSTDPGLSAAERKELRSREAKEGIADQEAGQRALHSNRERLRAERLAREAVAMRDPAPELPDNAQRRLISSKTLAMQTSGSHKKNDVGLGNYPK